MGARFELVIPCGGDLCDPRTARGAGEEALSLVSEWHDRLSAFDPDSLVSRLNSGAREAPVRVDPELFDLLEAAERIRGQSEGAFDVGVGGVMRSHGFRPGGTGETAGGEAVQGEITLDRGARTVRLVGGAEIDLGGIAKGGAIDGAMALLREAGVRSALMHGGTSTIAGMGAPPGAGAWTVRLGEGGEAPRVHLRDRSVSFSSSRPGGVEHVMDPRTGEPVAGVLAGACVGASALQTDAWATALMVRGERPQAMPGDLTSLLHTPGGWRIEGPDQGRIELGTQEVCL